MSDLQQPQQSGKDGDYSLLYYVSFYSHVNRNQEQKCRKCLKCGGEFASKHSGNRLCINCFTKNGLLRTRNLRV